MIHRRPGAGVTQASLSGGRRPVCSRLEAMPPTRGRCSHYHAALYNLYREKLMKYTKRRLDDLFNIQG